MTRPLLIVGSLVLVVYQAQAQSNGDQQQQQEDRSSSSDAVSSFQPSLAVVIGILCVMFSITFILLIYAKFCHRGAFARSNSTTNRPALVRSASRFSGIDKTAIESLPFFRFSSLKGSREGLECAVCLSKFEDVEILRLLPKCKHAFHINCVDAWLENHSSCPLCRCKVNPDDPTIFTYSNSMRFMFNNSELREDSNVELYVQREESHHGSSRFNVGSSFRKILKGNSKEGEHLIKKDPEDLEAQDQEAQGKAFHKFNHKIMVSDVVFKNRWSSVSSSDLMFLNSEMLNVMSSDRLSNSDQKTGQPVRVARGAEDHQEIMKIKEELEMKRLFESKVSLGGSSKNSQSSLQGLLPSSSSSGTNNRSVAASHPSIATSSGDRRAISEITSYARFGDLGDDDNGSRRRSPDDSGGRNARDERMRRIWLPIARRTVEWFANRERRSQQVERTGETLRV